jgi:hypothetical protein
MEQEEEALVARALLRLRSGQALAPEPADFNLRPHPAESTMPHDTSRISTVSSVPDILHR